MTDRLTVDTITSDALYDECDRLKHEVRQWKATYGEHALRDTLSRLRRAEGAVDRARRLASRWAVLRAYGGAVTELRAALDEPKVDDSSPAAPNLVHPAPNRQVSEPPPVDEAPHCTCTYGERCPNCRD
ncbi:hypothetical protein ACFY78_18735 [Streptomyces olindensis]|uniref:hypothetical protein n=1 Tax=Streptomyces olindensis TaxID=358823 RepID=UPI00368BC680